MKLSGSLPKDEANGLGPVARRMVDHPHEVHAVIALIDCKSTKVDHDSGALEATARIRRVDVVLDVDKPFAEAMLRRALERRSGMTELPFELERDIAAAFEGIDPISGEIFEPLDLADEPPLPEDDADGGE